MMNTSDPENWWQKTALAFAITHSWKIKEVKGGGFEAEKANNGARLKPEGHRIVVRANDYKFLLKAMEKHS